MKRNHSRKNLFLLCGILVLFLAILFCGIHFLDSAVSVNTEEAQTAQPYEKKTVTVDGVDYFPKQDITVVLAMGIDEEGEVKASESYNNTGEADVIALLVFDEKEESITVFSLNRDTMVEMPVLGLGGKKAGVAYGQLALSHTYGNGLEESCENTRDAIEHLINGLKVDYYISSNIDAINLVNDAVGGVTVDVTDDFSETECFIPMGRVTLKGEQAESYVRIRKGIGDQLNSSRMERQTQYIKGFIDALARKTEESDTFAYKLYDEISGYIVSDISLNAFTGMFERYSDYTLKEIITPEGENRMGEQFNEFYLDEEKFAKLVLDVFYAPKQFK